jgi:hypothetical protein
MVSVIVAATITIISSYPRRKKVPAVAFDRANPRATGVRGNPKSSRLDLNICYCTASSCVKLFSGRFCCLTLHLRLARGPGVFQLIDLHGAYAGAGARQKDYGKDYGKDDNSH